MRISLLPAANGDCILVEYAPLHYILIDGGYVDTYHNYLLPRLNDINAQGGVVDLLVVTHIDSDHISGIIKLLEEEILPVHIESIWYNGYKHVQSIAKISENEEAFVHENICKESIKPQCKSVSAKQGCTLSSLIIQKNLSWNEPADGGTMKALRTISLRNAAIHIISPNESDIESLGDFWKKRLIKDGLLSKTHSEGYWDDAFEFCMSKDRPIFRFQEKKVSKSYDLSKIKEESYVPDVSATNGSSISFVLEIDGKRVLFLGDSHAETIVESLTVLYAGEKEPYRFDAVKLSHHGSYNNNSPKLFSVISSDKWLISTNGDKYNHPDLPTLAYIITQNGYGSNNKLFFNYKLPICEELTKREYHKEYNYEIITSDDDKGVTITI